VTLFRTLRSKCRTVALLLAVALAAHGFMPAGKPAAHASADLDLERALQVICSAAGTRFPAQAPPMRPGDSCPLCPAFSAPAVAAPPTWVAVAADWVRVVVAPRPQFLPEALRLPRHALPRAPPHRSFV